MLLISKPFSSARAVSYHWEDITAKEQSDWSARTEVRSQWQGRLAESFGLKGAVDYESFVRLSLGQDPRTGEQLVRRLPAREYPNADDRTVKTIGHRAGWDASFSAPKSVSLTALVGGDNRVREAHAASVAAALEQLERYTMAGIRSNHNHPPEQAGRFVTAKFEHDTARPVDGYSAPQLHTHVVIFNITQSDDGAFHCVESRGLFASQHFATAIYRSELTCRLRQIGYEMKAGRSGAPEVDGYTREYLDASSPRTWQIHENLERSGYRGRQAAEIASYMTRNPKQVRSLADVIEAHRRLASEFGNQANAVVNAARLRVHSPAKEVDPRQRAYEAVAFACRRNFERRAVVDERVLVGDALRRGMGETTYPLIRAELEARLSSGAILTAARPSAAARQFGPPVMTAAEREILQQVRGKQNWVEPVTTRVEALRISDRHPDLTPTQRNAVEDVLSCPNRIQGIQGCRGIGKVATLSAVCSAVETQGYKVQGLAIHSRATRQLCQAGIEAGTLLDFLASSGAHAIGPEGKRFYFVDESSLRGTAQMGEFLRQLGPHDRVLLIGDSRPHQGADALRPFEQLQRAGLRTASLDEDPAEGGAALKRAVPLGSASLSLANESFLNSPVKLAAKVDSQVSASPSLKRGAIPPGLEFGL
jgi:conjugative relaxase-like TrwC/TraI family protein